MFDLEMALKIFAGCSSGPQGIFASSMDNMPVCNNLGRPA